MKRDDRRQAIMDMLVRDGAVELDALAEHFIVSKMTIHRDLDDLEAAGVLRKIRGGATIEAGTQFESDFRFRAQQGLDAKTRMADAALALVEPGMNVIINDGSMAAVLGARLVEKRPLTVITNNAAVIDALKSEAGITLIALGGIYSAKYNAYFGMVTETALSVLRADIAFVSTPAISGTEVFHMDESVVRTKRAMMGAAVTSCLLANHARFGRTALHKLAELSDFDTIITDKTPAAPDEAPIARAGLALTIAA
ncbi:Glycerol-3-phosphate regulon repressor [Aquimixticola soesokkakensis]|uniref:Glycerol-3-phosphate regulon repressor n=1 Tax=Aquimixticola soesokkakensis TaxID=1519096 RepID=A0A1Y5TFE8_9RHOB|nr:DeoR/GlpR family DNA-binding transcription regulator [Aquimixticola soesokkakensis]SLN62662.1 Glycerol-3-phosphate regulon repressor [Aquimixticola soesokkakensis]